MSQWKKTPFKTLKGAHQVAERLGLSPSSIIDTGRGFNSFQTKGTLIAQRTKGGPVLEKSLPRRKKTRVPLQDPNVPTFGEDDRLLTGPWTNSDHATLDAVRAHYQQLGPSTRHRFSFEGQILVVDYPDGDVVEYRQSGDSGVQQRALARAGHRTWRYSEPDPLGAAVEFQVGPWEQSIHKNLEVVEIHWRKKFVNFENVEALDVKLYRIGKDEYEYVQDINTGEVWCRKLSRTEEV